MKKEYFGFVDRLLKVTEGAFAESERTLRSEEEFLIDHFMSYAVMPGVLILESLVQTSIWHLRFLDHFKYPVSLLTSLPQAKFRHVVRPGETLRIQTELLSRQGNDADFRGKADAGGKTVLTARYQIRSYHVKEVDLSYQHLEHKICDKNRERFKELLEKS